VGICCSGSGIWPRWTQRRWWPQRPHGRLTPAGRWSCAASRSAPACGIGVWAADSSPRWPTRCGRRAPSAWSLASTATRARRRRCWRAPVRAHDHRWWENSPERGRPALPGAVCGWPGGGHGRRPRAPPTAWRPAAWPPRSGGEGGLGLDRLYRPHGQQAQQLRPCRLRSRRRPTGKRLTQQARATGRVASLATPRNCKSEAMKQGKPRVLARQELV